MSPATSLIDVGDSILIAIDVQRAFVDKLPAGRQRPLLNRMKWLLFVASHLGVPIILTAEESGRLGGPLPEITTVLPSGTTVYDKMIFDLSAVPEILSAVEASGRKTAVLIGLETDVCVAQSALGLLQQGFGVVVVADATASPGIGQTTGLERMRQAGAIIASVKSLYYEWLRTVDGEKRFREAHLGGSDLPEGVEL